MSLTSAKEGNTYIISYAFYDEAGSSMTPVSASWNLKDNLGNIVNNRSAVSIITPSSSGNIVLTKEDLRYEKNSSTFRIFTLSATYESVYASGCTVAESAIFDIDPLINN